MDRATDKGRERSFLAITVLHYGTVVLWCCLYLYMCMYVHVLATVYKQLLIRLYSSGSEYVGCCSWLFFILIHQTAVGDFPTCPMLPRY